MTKETRALERAAVAAHQAGTTWGTFWRQYGPHVIALEPHDRRRFHRLRQRLLGLVVSGDVDGSLPIDTGWERPCQWEIDDSPARLQRTFPVVEAIP